MAAQKAALSRSQMRARNALGGLGKQVGKDAQAEVRAALGGGGGAEYAQDHQANAGQLLNEGHGAQGRVYHDQELTGYDVDKREY